MTVTVPASGSPSAERDAAGGSQTTPSAPHPTASSTTPAQTSAAESKAFADGFSQVRARLSGPAGVAMVPVGGGQSLRAGDLPTGVAWSTSKVPLAIAALAAGDSAATRHDVTAAIRESDNASAERLWSGLGGGENASAAVEAVLRSAEDTTTQVPPQRTRLPYTAFGQTQWSTDLAAAFASNLPCLRGSSAVLDHMRHVSGNQQWGFWNISGAAVKGGWGPAGNGYLVRQIAVVPAGDGQVGVAALVQAASFEAGQRDLDAIATWARGYLPGMGGKCA